jgi:hypothetical protein
LADWFSDNAPKDDWFTSNQRPQTPDQAAMAAGAKSPTASQMFKPTVQPKEEYIDPRAQVVLRMGEVLGHPENLPSALVDNLRHPLQSNINQAVQTATTVATQPTKTSTASAAIGAVLGLPVTAITQSAQKAGRTGEYGDLAGQFVQGALMGKGAGRAISEAVPVTEYTNTLPKVPDSAAAEAITNAVNPPAKQMPAFQKNVESQLPNIREEAEASNLPIKNRDALLSVVRNAAAKKRSFYYDSIIKPFEDVPKDVNQIPGYQGPTSQPGFATIGQLDKRLTQINAELYPKYQKGGMQSTAALNVQSDAALRAEAAAIRTVMNQELANRLNMTPEQVGQSRADFGQLGDLADKLELTLNTERRAVNKTAQQSPDLHITTMGVANKIGQALSKRVLGSPADRAVKKVF